MKILVTGAGGMLGTDLVLALKEKFAVTGAGRNVAPHLGISFTPCDLSVPGAALELLKKDRPAFVFHSAAMTNVDACEQDRVEAMRQNREMSTQIAKACFETKSFLIFFSTDYVFDGTKKGEWLEADRPAPLNVYGESKLAAEEAIADSGTEYAIFRVSWLYGMKGKSFPRTILEKARQQKSFDIVDDQFGAPTFTEDLAKAFLNLLQDPLAAKKMNRQIFHLANSGFCSWAELAKVLLEEAGHTEIVVNPIKSSQLTRPAKRPQNSVFSLKKAEQLLGLRLRPWQEAAREFARKFQ